MYLMSKVWFSLYRFFMIFGIDELYQVVTLDIEFHFG
jgi:hypothetical protein